MKKVPLFLFNFKTKVQSSCIPTRSWWWVANIWYTKIWNVLGPHAYTFIKIDIIRTYICTHTFTNLHSSVPHVDQVVWYHLCWSMQTWVFSSSNVEQISSPRYFLLPFLFSSCYYSLSHREITMPRRLRFVHTYIPIF